MCNIKNMPKTNISENMKGLMNRLGFGLGLNREGNYYLTDNKQNMPMQVKETVDGTTLATSLDKSKYLSFKVGNKLVNKETNFTRPIFDLLSISDISNKTTIIVNHYSNSNIPNSFVELKLTKDFDGKPFIMSIILLENGSIDISINNVQAFAYTLEESSNIDSLSAKRLLANLELADEKLLPIIEYYANSYPLVLTTITNIKEISQRKEKRHILEPNIA